MELKFMKNTIALLILSFLMTPVVFAQNLSADHGVGNLDSEHGVGNGGDPRELFLLNVLQAVTDAPELVSSDFGDNRFKFSVESRFIHLRISSFSGVCVQISRPEHKVELSLNCFQNLEGNPKALLLTLTNAIAAVAGIEALDSENFGAFSKSLVTDAALQRYASRLKLLSDDCLYRFDSRLKLDEEIRALAEQTLEGRNYTFSPNADLVIGDESNSLSILSYDSSSRSLTRLSNAVSGFSFLENVQTTTRRVKNANADAFLTELLRLPFCRTR
jgi:hypothetical protein